MFYYGTELDSYGHYLWELNGRFTRTGLPHSTLGFDPEKHRMQPRGHVKFEHEGGWTILYIGGSPKDTRLGTSSVFFLRGDFSRQDFVNLMRSNSVAMSIVERIPYDIDLEGNESVA